MLVRNEEFCEEWREGFDVVITLKNESPIPAFEFTYTTRDEAEALKTVIEKMVEGLAIDNISEVRVEEVYY